MSDMSCKVPWAGTVRDRVRRMLNALLHGLVLAAAVSCQQDDRHESAGDGAGALSPAPRPIPTSDEDVRAAQVDLADGNAWRATRRVYPALRAPERRSPEALLGGRGFAAAR